MVFVPAQLRFGVVSLPLSVTLPRCMTLLDLVRVFVIVVKGGARASV